MHPSALRSLLLLIAAVQHSSSLPLPRAAGGWAESSSSSGLRGQRSGEANALPTFDTVLAGFMRNSQDDLPSYLRERSLAEATPAAAGTRPKIYIYNLSATWRDQKEYAQIANGPYGMEITFADLLHKSPYVTTNPEEADYFYVWAWMYNSQTDRNSTKLIEELQKLPYLARRGGKDHIITLVHDLGLCDGQSFNEDFRNFTVLEHWGRSSSAYPSNVCHLYDSYGTSCDQVFAAIEQHHHHDIRMRHKTPCYTAHKDLMIPATGSEGEATTRFLNSTLAAMKQDVLAFFAGGINLTHLTNPANPEMDAGYSFGVRQTFAKLYENDPEIKVFYKMVPNYWVEMGRAKFCLAPAGWGWGSRVKAAIVHGCVPIIIQEGIKVDWEDQLPYFDFAVRMPMAYIHRIPELLHKFEKTGKLQAFQTNLKCVWRLFWWSRPHGRAFEMTMCTLKARALGHKVHLDLGSCTLRCGDHRAVHFNNDDGIHSV